MRDTTERRYRTIWISDIHLGTPSCRASDLLDFLRWNESDTLYLVGDVVDGWALRRSWHWEQSHNDVVQKLLRKARKGTRVLYLPGNHDEFARAYVGHRFGDIEVAEDALHRAADGRTYLIVHGDRFDPVVASHRWLVPVVHRIVDLFRVLGFRWLWRGVGSLFGRPYRSLAAYVKGRANQAMAALGDFERLATAAARARGADGVICGHVHVPSMREIDGTVYANDGDWVDSCTAFVEHDDGRLEFVRWAPGEGRALPGEAKARAVRERLPSRG